MIMLEKMNTFTNLLTRRISGERRAINAENQSGKKAEEWFHWYSSE